MKIWNIVLQLSNGTAVQKGVKASNIAEAMLKAIVSVSGISANIPALMETISAVGGSVTIDSVVSAGFAGQVDIE